MRKIFKFLIMFVIFICIFHTSVNAEDNKVFSITNATGKKNNEVTVYISLNKKVEFASADLILEYDTSKLEYVKYEELDVFKKSAMNIVKNNSETGKIAIGYVSNPDLATVPKNPGQCLSITFKIKSGNNEKTKLNLKCTSLKNDAGDSIQVSDVQSEITISSNNNSSNNNNSNNNKSQNTENSDVINTLPKTGAKNIITIMFLLLSIFISYYFYKKYNIFKDIS